MSLSEWATRKQHVDRALTEAGWVPIVPYDDHTPRNLVVFEEHPTASGPADYALFHTGDPLAIVEAKKLGVGPQNVLKQAQRYAKGLSPSPFDFNGYHVPFIYSTNGKVIWFQDLRNPYSRSRQVAHFHTPAALLEMLARDLDAAADWLQTYPTAHPILRPYQHDAINAIEAALLQGKREILVAMATGTGKTLTTIALLYRLIKSGFARRVLFLVDRRALAAQAVTAFSRFQPEFGLKFDKIYEVYSQQFRREDFEDTKFDPRVLPHAYLTQPDPSHAFVYVSTIQRMMINLFGYPQGTGWSTAEETDAETLDIPIHAFDVIVADECHRGYTASETGKWRETLEHFDGIKIGLTATPAPHTSAYFGKPMYTYNYDRAVEEGYLVDYEPTEIRSQMAMQGTFLRPGEAVTLVDWKTGAMRYDELEDERELSAAQLQREWTAVDHDRKIVQEVARYLRAFEEERGYFPRTLVFAQNDIQHISHCDRLVNLFRDEFGRGDGFVEKITGTVDRPLQRIREFRNRPEPCIAVTVDMLSTGVDIPGLEAIVFLRPVKSRILFEQMMGRGTRRSDDIGKTHFMVLDAAGVLPYFAQASAFTDKPPTKATHTVTEVIDAIYNNQDRDYNIRVLVRRLHRVSRAITGEGREQFKRFIPDGDIAAFARGLHRALDEDWATTMAILRDLEFQRLLTDYPRAKKAFLIAEEVEDDVTSGVLIRTADWKIVRPDDYLREFERFVRENPEQIEAIRILLDRPADWNTGALGELRRKLGAHNYTEDDLRKAYHHELADIISMVKHAASGDPLLSAEERVDQALAQVRAGKTFTPEQERWLALIRNHLVENLAIDRKDFGLLTFTRAGATWGRVNRDFEGTLTQVLVEINEAMAT